MSRRTALRMVVAMAVGVGWSAVGVQAQAAPAALHVAGEVQLVTAASETLYHTIRHVDGSWDRFGTVLNASPRDHLVAAIVAGQAHVMYESAPHHPPITPWLSQAIRHADGTWSSETVPHGDQYFTADLAVASVSDELHLVRRNVADLVLRHQVRHADGTWSTLPDLPNPVASNSSVGVAGLNGELRLLIGQPGDRTLSYYVARTDGTWSEHTSVMFNPLTDAGPSTVDLARAGAELHAVIRGTDGMLYHSMQRPSGAWDQFHTINSQIPMPEGVYNSVSITGVQGTLHVAVSTRRDGDLFHTVRRPDGTWSGFGGVHEEAGRHGYTVAVAGE